MPAASNFSITAAYVRARAKQFDIATGDGSGGSERTQLRCDRESLCNATM